MSYHDPAVVREALADQLACYERLTKLAEEQGRAIYAGDTDRLLKVIARREDLTTQAAELEQAIGPVKQAWPGVAVHWSEEDTETVREMFRQCKQMLGDLTRTDDRDAATIRARLATCGGDLKQAEADRATVRRINNRYAAAAYAKPSQRLDRSS
jgi:hypothetical protein